MEDIEIARNAKLKNVVEIAKKLKIDEEFLEQYGKYKAKISNKIYDKLKNEKNGKLILVTAINPTPLGEGKTTMSIGLADGLSQIGKKSILALREPSLGPVFGIKGGATGGGYVQVAPMEEINLHFTGDIHAITSANNLLAAMIDNHIFSGNSLGFDKVVWKRCVDLNDRALRKVQIALSGEKGAVPREDGFDISVASEIMAIFCLAEDLEDLRDRIGNIVIGYNKEGKEIKAKQLNAQGAMAVLLKDAINPNLVQTLENTPAIIHGGPFANIAHGCNSVIATKLAMKLGDYTITEAGFGADLGAEKFLDIKCRLLPKVPDSVVIVATMKALKYHGGLSIEKIKEEDIKSLDIGIHNLLKHVDNIKNKFGLNVIIAINRFITDTDKEIKYLEERLKEYGINLSLVEAWAKGGKGATDLAEKVCELCEKPNNFKYTYELTDNISEKIEKIAKNIYGANKVEFSEEALEKINALQETEYKNLPVCIAKTQYSLSDDATNLLCDKPFNIHVRDVILKSGAGFIVVLTGNIFTMPGLPKVPAAEKIDINKDGNIVGIF